MTKLKIMKASTNSTWYWISFDNGEIWYVYKYDYVKVLESLLSKSQFEKDFKNDGTYKISKKRYNTALELHKTLSAKRN